MELREAKDKDVPRLVELHSQYDFPLNLDNTFAHKVVEEKGITAVGWLQLIVESTVILDIKSREKFRALELLLNQAKVDALKTGFDQVHAFAKDPKFAAILKKHFDFKDTIGSSLVLNLEKANG